MSDTGLFYHERVGLPIRIAGTLGITAAAFLSGRLQLTTNSHACANEYKGQTAASSYLTTPALLEAPAP